MNLILTYMHIPNLIDFLAFLSQGLKNSILEPIPITVLSNNPDS